MATKKPKRRVRTKQTLPPLSLVQLIACDAVARDPSTSKPTLYGVFDNIIVDAVPQKSAFSLFAKLSGRGKYPVSIVLVDPKGKPQTLAEIQIDIAKDGIGTIQMMVGVELRTFGVYSLQVKSGRKKVGDSCAFKVVKKK